MKMHNDLSDIFTGIELFQRHIPNYRVREGNQPYQAMPRMVAYALQEPLQIEVDSLEKQHVRVPLDIDEYQNGVTALCWSQRQVVRFGYALFGVVKQSPTKRARQIKKTSCNSTP